MAEAETPTYPTWVKIQPGRWESDENIQGIPDFIATREKQGWRLKWRSSSQATVGFRTIEEVKEHVRMQVRDMDERPVINAVQSHQDADVKAVADRIKAMPS